MAITKTGIKLTEMAEAGREYTFEENGQVNRITATGLEANTTYTVSGYVVDSSIGTITSQNIGTATTMPAGRVEVIDTDAYFDGDSAFIVNAKFQSEYEIDTRSIEIRWSEWSDMSSYTTYTPDEITMDSDTEGTLEAKIEDDEGGRYYQLVIGDIYGYYCPSTIYAAQT